MVFGAIGGLSGLGSIASGIGSIAGAFGGGGGVSNKRRNAAHKDALYWEKVRANELPRSMVQGAKRAGLHPLSVLGMNLGSGPSVSVGGGNSGIDYNAIGQGIDRAANAGRTKVARELDNLALEKAKLSNDYLRTQIAGAQTAIAKSAATVPLGNKGLSSINSDKLPLSRTDLVELLPAQEVSKSSKDSGSSAGKPPAFKNYDIGNGQQVNMPYSQDGWAEGLGELPVWFKHPKMAEVLWKRYYHGSPGYYLAKKMKKAKKWWKSRK